LVNISMLFVLWTVVRRIRFAGDQIFDRFRKKRPDVDLSFLDESDSEEVEVVEPVQGAEVEVVEPVPRPEDAEGANAGGIRTAGGDGEL